MTTTIEIHRASDSMIKLGWITITKTQEGEIAVYGIFPNAIEATIHGDKLINATVVPIYAPTLH
jgi:hypothetical protein